MLCDDLEEWNGAVILEHKKIKSDTVSTVSPSISVSTNRFLNEYFWFGLSIMIS